MIISPKFSPGDIITLKPEDRSASFYLPDRIKIRSVYMTDANTEWQYRCYSEQANGEITMPQLKLSNLILSTTAPVYQLPQIKELLMDGWHWVANGKASTMQTRAETICLSNKFINKVQLRTAYTPKGGRMDDDKLGLWIKYDMFIRPGGTPTYDTYNDFVKFIK